MTRAILLCLVAFQGFASGAQAQQDCAAEVRSILAAAQEAILSSPGQALTASIQVTTVTNAEEEQRSEERIVIASGHDRIIMDNALFSVFQDAKTRVVVIPADSLLCIYDTPGQSPVPDAGMWVQQIDLFRRTGEATTCKRVKTEGNERLEVTFSFNEKANTGALKSVRIAVDPVRKRPLEVETTYRPGARLFSQGYRYLSYYPGRLDPRLNKPSSALALTAKGLVPAYSGFELRDMRQRLIDHVQD